MLIPIDDLQLLKSALADIGVSWSSEALPSPYRPLCTGLLNGRLVAIYQESETSALCEFVCLDSNYSGKFEELLTQFYAANDEPTDTP